MRQLLPFLTGSLTLVAMWLAGSKRTAAWAVGLANQVLWAATIVAFGVWGLAPLTAALTVIYTRNLLRWQRESRRKPVEHDPPLRYHYGAIRITGPSGTVTEWRKPA